MGAMVIVGDEDGGDDGRGVKRVLRGWCALDG